MKKYKIRVEGITPYMQHRMDDQKLEEWEKSHARVVSNTTASQTDAIRAEFHCHRNEYNKQYHSTEERKNYREGLNKVNRADKGYGDGKDLSHTRSGKLVKETRSSNRARNGKGDNKRLK